MGIFDKTKSDHVDTAAPGVDVSLGKLPAMHPAQPERVSPTYTRPQTDQNLTPLERYKRQRGTEDWKHNAAVAKRGWLPNSEVSEQDYITAVEEAANEEIR